MSGGHFEYVQYRITEAGEEVDRLIRDNSVIGECGYAANYPPEILAKFAEASHWLHRAGEMLQRIDWLVSGDDGLKQFLARWAEEVRPVNNGEGGQ